MSKQNFTNVTPSVNYPEMETQILDLWKQKDVFRRSMEERKDGPRYVFFEGPPTANGRPGIHHVLARAFKDMFPRYKAMQGHYVLRKGGWDTHGLPVEIEVPNVFSPNGLHIQFASPIGDQNAIDNIRIEGGDPLGIGAVPAPATVWLLVTGLLGIGGLARRRPKAP